MSDRAMYFVSWVITSVSLFLLGAAYATHINKPKPDVAPACISPTYEFGCDSPELRLWAASLNKDVCFKDKMWERPDTVGLNRNQHYYKAPWD